MFGRALHIRKVIANIPDSGRGRNERWSRLDISAELICISETPHHTSLSRHTRNTPARDIAADPLQMLSQLSLSVLLFLLS